MATKPKVPPPNVPIVEADGRCNVDWYRFFSSLPLVNDGAVATTATAGAATLPVAPVGFYTKIIDNVRRKVAYYAE